MMADANGHLYSELGELARYLDTTLRKLDDAGAPIATMSDQLPEAASHLEGLTKLTEEGTHEVMRLTEEIQDSHALIAGMISKATALVVKGQIFPCVACLLRESQQLVAQDDVHLIDSRERLAGTLSQAAETLTKGQSGNCIACALTESKHRLLQDDKRLIEIMTSLSFQDLVAQRVKKLTTIIHDVERKLLELVVVFGLKHDGTQPEVKTEATDLLKELNASSSNAMKQDLVDDILGKFGFN
jgi:chemotaxis protein CheZ